MGFFSSRNPPNRSNRFDDAPPKSIYGCESLPLSVQYPSPRDMLPSLIDCQSSHSIPTIIQSHFHNIWCLAHDLCAAMICLYGVHTSQTTISMYLINDWQSSLSMRSLARSGRVARSDRDSLNVQRDGACWVAATRTGA